MRIVTKMIPPVLFALGCAACSSQQAPAPATQPVPAATTRAAAPAPADAIPLSAPASGGSSSTVQAETRDKGPSLADMLRRPAFAKAFASVEGASRLPAWVGQGGVSTPSEQVQVEGSTVWLAHECKTDDCGDGEIWLLIDQDTRMIQGVFVDEHGDSSAQVRELVWLGNPDAATRTFLKQRIAED